MKKIIHLTIFLALIAAIAGSLLAFSNKLTAPVIAKNELAAEKASLKMIYPDVSDKDFVLVKQDASKTIKKIYEVKGKGYIFKMQVPGYKDGTVFLVALKKDGTVSNYVAISNGDTQGLGTKVTEKPFRDSLIGEKATSNEILNDTISGATITSKPVIQGIQEAAKYQAEHLK